jgi:hypothetical protein
MAWVGTHLGFLKEAVLVKKFLITFCLLHLHFEMFFFLMGDFKIGGKIIHTVKYVDDLVLLAKEVKVLQDMTDKEIEIGRFYGWEMNVGKTKTMRIQDNLCK